MDEFTRYYMNQVGGGGGEEERIGPVYRAGFSRGQRGRGVVTNALKGIWNWVSPLFSSSAKAVGQQALSTGAQILADAGQGGNLKEAVKRRATEGRDALVTKMRGGGRRRRRVRKVRTKGDIFDGI